MEESVEYVFLKFPVLVVDFGAGEIKAGFAGDVEPRLKEPCVLARKPHITGKSPASACRVSTDTRAEQCWLFRYCITVAKTYFGKRANQWYINDPEVEKIWPHPSFINGKGNILEMYQILDYVIERLNIANTEDYLLIMTTWTIGDDPFIRQGLDWAFNEHNFKAVAFVHEGYAALRSFNIDTGLVLDVGECGSRVIPIVSNHGVDIASVRYSKLSGYFSNLFFREILRCNNFPTLSLDLAVVDEIKQNVCCVCMDSAKEKKSSNQGLDTQTIVLPQCYGEISVSITTEERLLIPEIFFHPSLLIHILPGMALAHSGENLPQMIVDSLSSCPLDLRSTIQSNLVVVGGTCNTPNFLKRLQQELAMEMFNRFPTLPVNKRVFHIVDLNGTHTKDRGTIIFNGASFAEHGIVRCSVALHIAFCNYAAIEMKQITQLWISREEYLLNKSTAIKRANATAIKGNCYVESQ